MKFMKLGAKPDTFYTEEAARSVSTEVSSDFIIQVNGVKYFLHKFPLLSKCGLLQRLAAEACDSEKEIIELQDFPGSLEAFEFCAKFCYGITVTVGAFNLVVVRCAAEFLQMTEAMDKGNLIYKLEIFFNSCILHGWKDSIITLQTTKALLPWSEDLRIVNRCIDAIACKAMVDPSRVNWSYSYSRGQKDYKSSESGSSPSLNELHSRRYYSVPKDWWVEDIAELKIDLYWRVMLAIKSTGKISSVLIGEALRVYASRWLPGMSKEKSMAETGKGNAKDHSNDKYAEITTKHRLLLESIVSLLPPEKGSTSCRFLLKLLKAATILGVSPSSKTELARRVGLQLEEASVNDLLIPSLSYANETLYDVDLVQTILEHFMMQSQSPPTSPFQQRHKHEKRRTRSAENLDFVESRRSSSAAHSSKLKVAKLIDAYLAEIARDANLSISRFTSLAEAIPDFARPVHDDLYRAIDIYLKEHPELSKTERKSICRLMDCKKLSMEACMHAAQNELLPLRLVVQVLFVEQARATMSGGLVNELPNNIKALLSSHEEDSQVIPESSTFDNGWDAVNHHVKSSKEGDAMTLKMEEYSRQKLRQGCPQILRTQGSITWTAKICFSIISIFPMYFWCSESSWCEQAKPETLSKVCDIVKSRLALSEDKPLTPESKFSDLGAESLDTVEIVMALEEEFKISVEEENAGTITTVQEAADLIERLAVKSLMVHVCCLKAVQVHNCLSLWLFCGSGAR